ncbi:hypothetical protein [Cellulomonas timonensis]|uniref:hypothetical protein n=1 Tax=Cellulomonas timonensis TaxID=1689271 RepID=UPI001F4227C6|nr:hypothetical protein [Cellulomonas timonensis]
MRAPLVFGWVVACHQIGAAIAATAAGMTRDHYGAYTPAWYIAGGLSIVAVFLSLRIAAAKLDTAPPIPPKDKDLDS